MVLKFEEEIALEELKHKQKLELLTRQEEIANNENQRKLERLTKIENIALMQKFTLNMGEN